MSGKVTRDQIIAITLLKWVRSIIDAYKGPENFKDFKTYLNRILNEKNFKADAILAEAATELL